MSEQGAESRRANKEEDENLTGSFTLHHTFNFSVRHLSTSFVNFSGNSQNN